MAEHRRAVLWPDTLTDAPSQARCVAEDHPGITQTCPACAPALYAQVCARHRSDRRYDQPRPR